MAVVGTDGLTKPPRGHCAPRLTACFGCFSALRGDPVFYGPSPLVPGEIGEEPPGDVHGRDATDAHDLLPQDPQHWWQCPALDSHQDL